MTYNPVLMYTYVLASLDTHLIIRFGCDFLCEPKHINALGIFHICIITINIYIYIYQNVIYRFTILKLPIMYHSLLGNS